MRKSLNFWPSVGDPHKNLIILTSSWLQIYPSYRLNVYSHNVCVLCLNYVKFSDKITNIKGIISVDEYSQWLIAKKISIYFIYSLVSDNIHAR